MHPIINVLAQGLGTKIVDRDAQETWLYDGKTFASHYWIKPDPMDVPGDKYYFAPFRVDYGDVDLLHELGHLLSALPEQKDLPEFGLAMGIANGSGYGPNGGETLRKTNGELSEVVFDGLVDAEEQGIQETMAQLFSIYWGVKYQVDFWMKGWDLPNNWDYYFQYKIIQNDGKPHDENSLKRTWEALIRFHEILYLLPLV